MAVNQSLDSLQFPTLEFFYDKTRSTIQDNPPRLVAGTNLYITPSGTISRRPGTSPMNNTNAPGAYRVDRLWIYETVETPAQVYMIASLYSPGPGTWSLGYQRLNSTSPAAWALVPNLRQVNSSTYPHEAVSGRGFFYVKSFPTQASGEKLGTVVLDASGGTMRTYPWGLLGPTTPVQLNAVGVSKLTAAITAAAGTLTVASVAPYPVVPFLLQLDYEQVNCTALAGTTYTVTRAMNGTVASPHAAGTIAIYRNWVASAHPITVNFGWEYSYCYKTITGQYSNRAPVQTNPDAAPSSSGPFFNLVPQILVQGLADTTNFPTIAILRKTDGGGTWYILDEVTNTGAGSIAYTDNKLASGAGNADPQPDTILSQPFRGFAPSLTSNSPPPSVIAPSVVGVDTPVRCSPLAYYAGRIWYIIGNILVGSSQEELNVGIGEESFSSGIKGLFFRLQHQGINLQATKNGLFVFTTNETFVLIGTNLQTFTMIPFQAGYGMPYGHPRAITRFGDNVAFLTHDYRIALMNENQIRIISDSLYTDIIDAIAAGGEIDIKYWADIDKQWLVVASHHNTPSLSRQWVFDINRTLGEEVSSLEAKTDDFWFVPWTYPSTCLASGRILEANTRRKLILANYAGGNSALAILDSTFSVYTDWTATSAFTNFDCSGTTSMFRVPAGDHVNKLRGPYLTPILYSLIVDRTSFAGDTDPDIFVYMDDLWTTPQPTSSGSDPASRSQSLGYKTTEYGINQACQRAAFKFQKNGLNEGFELQQMQIVYNADSGR